MDGRFMVAVKGWPRAIGANDEFFVPGSFHYQPNFLARLYCDEKRFGAEFGLLFVLIASARSWYFLWFGLGNHKVRFYIA